MRTHVLTLLVACVSPVARAQFSPAPTVPSLAFTVSRNANMTRRVVARDVVPAMACSENAQAPCDGSDAFCCEESTQCVLDPSTSPATWTCLDKGDVDSAMACGASDTACEDGVSCCPEDMSCAAEGGCVSELDDGCADGETLCVEACCTEAETCDTQTGVCMSAQDMTTANSTSTSSAPSSSQSNVTATATATALRTASNQAHAEEGPGAVLLAVLVGLVTILAAQA